MKLSTDGTPAACARFRRGAGAGLIPYSTSRFSDGSPGGADRCGAWASGRIRFAAGMVAGRGVLRAERAVVLHRDAAVRAAACGAGGSRIRSGHRRVRRFFTRRSPRRVAWLAEFAPERACLAAPFLWVAMEFALAMHLPAIGFPWNLLGYVAAGNLSVRATDGDHRDFRPFAGGRGLQRAGGLGRPANVAAQAGGHDAWIGANAVLIVIALAGRVLSRKRRRSRGAFGADEFSRSSNGYPSDWMQSARAEMDQLEQISIGAAQKIPGIVVWPEVPAPFSLQDANFLARAQRIARGAGGGFLVGVIDWKPLAGGGIGPNNSAALLGSERRAGFHLRQDSSRALQRIRAVEERLFLPGIDEPDRRFSAWHAIQSWPHFRRAVQRLHLLRGDFPE
jgi:hypothetical protein